MTQPNVDFAWRIDSIMDVAGLVLIAFMLFLTVNALAKRGVQLGKYRIGGPKVRGEPHTPAAPEYHGIERRCSAPFAEEHAQILRELKADNEGIFVMLDALAQSMVLVVTKLEEGQVNGEVTKLKTGIAYAQGWMAANKKSETKEAANGNVS